jgi:branched-chain amino acid transport system substrate-binding protein
MPENDSFVEKLQRRRFLRLSGAAGAAGLAGCLNQEDVQGGDGGDGGDEGTDADDGGSSEPVVVGADVPVSGDLSDFGGPMLNAMRMAVEDINDAGGPLGREFQVNDEDSGTDTTQGVNAANKLVNTDDVDALIGAVSSGVTISVAQSVTVPNDVVHLNSASSSPSISSLDDKDLLFRTRTNDRFVREGDGAHRLQPGRRQRRRHLRQQ